MNLPIHLAPLQSIQDGLKSGEFQLSDLFHSFVDSVNNAADIDAWEVISKSFILDNKSFGPATGLFIGVKDNIATKDLPTTMGSAAWSGSTKGFDARVVSKLRQNGAFVAGKTKCSAFAVHDTTGTLNPRYLDSEPGTSSSGSAAAIASNQVSIALGTQTAGSIIKPASYCGVIGFKPTFGDIPRTGILKTTEMFDSVGFLGRRIADIKEVYFSCRVSGRNHPVHELKRFTSKDSKFRKGLILSGDGVDSPSTFLNSYFHQSVQAISEELELELSLIDGFDFEGLRKSLFMVYYKELAYYLTIQNLNVGLSSNLQEIISYGSQVSFAEYEEAKRIISDWRIFVDTKSQDSLVFSLSTSSSAPKVGCGDLIDANFFINSVGLPQLSLPLLRDSDGKIVNLCLSSPRFSDTELLNIGLGLFPQDALEVKSFG